MFWGQALIEFRRTNKARSWPNFRAWHLKTDSKSAFASSFGGSRSPPLTTSFGISAFDMSRGTHPPTLPMSSRTHPFPNRRPPDHRIAHNVLHSEVFQRLTNPWGTPHRAGRQSRGCVACRNVRRKRTKRIKSWSEAASHRRGYVSSFSNFSGVGSDWAR